MDLSKYVQMEESYDDLRFGPVAIFYDPENEQDIICIKKRQFSCIEEFHEKLKIANERLQFLNPYILKMLFVESDRDLLTINIGFQYPNEDLVVRAGVLKSPNEVLKFLHDILCGMAFLQEHKMVHGNIRPEYIYFDPREENYVLLDRFGDFLTPNQVQHENIVNDLYLYLDPAIFVNLCKNNQNFSYHPYRAETFALGIVAISMILYNEGSDERSPVQDIYDRDLATFNEIYLQSILESVKTSYFTTPESELIFDFINYCLLTLNTSQRLGPIKAYKMLKKTLWKFSNSSYTSFAHTPEENSMSETDGQQDKIIVDSKRVEFTSPMSKSTTSVNQKSREFSIIPGKSEAGHLLVTPEAKSESEQRLFEPVNTEFNSHSRNENQTVFESNIQISQQFPFTVEKESSNMSHQQQLNDSLRNPKENASNVFFDEMSVNAGHHNDAEMLSSNSLGLMNSKQEIEKHHDLSSFRRVNPVDKNSYRSLPDEGHISIHNNDNVENTYGNSYTSSYSFTNPMFEQKNAMFSAINAKSNEDNGSLASHSNSPYSFHLPSNTQPESHVSVITRYDQPENKTLIHVADSKIEQGQNEGISEKIHHSLDTNSIQFPNYNQDNSNSELKLELENRPLTSAHLSFTEEKRLIEHQASENNKYEPKDDHNSLMTNLQQQAHTEKSADELPALQSIERLPNDSYYLNQNNGDFIFVNKLASRENAINAQNISFKAPDTGYVALDPSSKQSTPPQNNPPVSNNLHDIITPQSSPPESNDRYQQSSPALHDPIKTQSESMKLKAEQLSHPISDHHTEAKPTDVRASNNVENQLKIEFPKITITYTTNQVDERPTEKHQQEQLIAIQTNTPPFVQNIKVMTGDQWDDSDPMSSRILKFSTLEEPNDNKSGHDARQSESKQLVYSARGDKDGTGILPNHKYFINDNDSEFSSIRRESMFNNLTEKFHNGIGNHAGGNNIKAMLNCVFYDSVKQIPQKEALKGDARTLNPRSDTSILINEIKVLESKDKKLISQSAFFINAPEVSQGTKKHFSLPDTVLSEHVKAHQKPGMMDIIEDIENEMAMEGENGQFQRQTMIEIRRSVEIIPENEKRFILESPSRSNSQNLRKGHPVNPEDQKIPKMSINIPELNEFHNLGSDHLINNTFEPKAIPVGQASPKALYQDQAKNIGIDSSAPQIPQTKVIVTQTNAVEIPDQQRKEVVRKPSLYKRESLKQVPLPISQNFKLATPINTLNFKKQPQPIEDTKQNRQVISIDRAISPHSRDYRLNSIAESIPSNNSSSRPTIILPHMQSHHRLIPAPQPQLQQLPSQTAPRPRVVSYTPELKPRIIYNNEPNNFGVSHEKVHFQINRGPTPFCHSNSMSPTPKNLPMTKDGKIIINKADYESLGNDKRSQIDPFSSNSFIQNYTSNTSIQSKGQYETTWKNVNLLSNAQPTPPIKYQTFNYESGSQASSDKQPNFYQQPNVWLNNYTSYASNSSQMTFQGQILLEDQMAKTKQVSHPAPYKPQLQPLNVASLGSNTSLPIKSERSTREFFAKNRMKANTMPEYQVVDGQGDVAIRNGFFDQDSIRNHSPNRFLETNPADLQRFKSGPQSISEGPSLIQPKMQTPYTNGPEIKNFMSNSTAQNPNFSKKQPGVHFNIAESSFAPPMPQMQNFQSNPQNRPGFEQQPQKFIDHSTIMSSNKCRPQNSPQMTTIRSVNPIRQMVAHNAQAKNDSLKVISSDQKPRALTPIRVVHNMNLQHVVARSQNMSPPPQPRLHQVKQVPLDNRPTLIKH